MTLEAVVVVWVICPFQSLLVAANRSRSLEINFHVQT